MNWRTLAAYSGLLLLEVQWLTWAHPEGRELMRSLVGLPLLKVAFTFVGVVALYVFLKPEITVPPLRPFSASANVVHLISLALFTWIFGVYSGVHVSAVELVLVFGVAAVWLASWLLCLWSPTACSFLLRRQAVWLGAAGVVSVVFVSLAEAAEAAWTGVLLQATFAGAGGVLRCVFAEPLVLPERAVLGAEDFMIEVTDKCSGYEGIGLILLFLASYLWVRRHELRFPRALWLLPLGVALSWLLNCFRLAALVVLGARYSPRLAFEGFHSNAGWLAFIVVAACFVFAVERCGWFRKCRVAKSSPSAPYLIPMLVLLFFSMLGSVFSQGLDLFYPIKVLVLGGVFWHYWGFYGELLERPHMQAVVWGFGVYLVWLAMVPAKAMAVSDALLTSAAGLVWLVFRVVGASVFIPLAEELAFRGYLLRRMQAEQFKNVPWGRFTAVSFLGSSLAFGLLHEQLLAGLVAGMAYAYTTSLSGGFSNAVWAHATTNLFLSLHVLLWQRWDLWL